MVPKIDRKKFLLKRRLIEIRKFLRECRSLLADFPNVTWASALRNWMEEHREEQSQLRTQLKDHLKQKTRRPQSAIAKRQKAIQ